jgi:hypothetical protein
MFIPPHIGDAAHNRNLHPCWKRGHCPSNTASIREIAFVSTPTVTLTWCWFGRAILAWQSGGRPGSTDCVGSAGAFVTVTGANDTAWETPSGPFRYCRRHVVRSDRQMPCRRAMGATWRWRIKLSSTKRSLSLTNIGAVHHRYEPKFRRPPPEAYRGRLRDVFENDLHAPRPLSRALPDAATKPNARSYLCCRSSQPRPEIHPTRAKC